MTFRNGATPAELGLGPQPLTRISVFMNVFNVHVNRTPVDGMVANGYEPEFAEKTFKQLEGFGSYGFPPLDSMGQSR